MSNTNLNTKHRVLGINNQPVPNIPLNGQAKLYLSSVTGDLSIIKDTGDIVNLEFDINNLPTAMDIDVTNDFLNMYDTSLNTNNKETIQNIINAGVSSILTTRGDILIRDATEPVRLDIGPVGNFLYSDGTDISWSDTTKRLNIQTKNITINGSYTISLLDNQILNLTTSSGNDIINLPDATTLPEGWEINIINNETSTEHLKVRIYDTTILQVIGIGKSITFELLHNLTQNGVWDVHGRTDHNILNVGESNTKFTSINDAIASITDNSPTNRYQIRVSPGNYIETPILMKSYVSLYSNVSDVTFIIADSVNDTIITGAHETSISNITIIGATGTNGIGIYIDSLNEFKINNCTIKECETLIKVESTAAETDIIIQDCELYARETNGLWIDGTSLTSSFDINVLLKSNKYYGPISGTSNSILAEGQFGLITALGENFIGNGTLGTAIVGRDLITLTMTNIIINKYNIGMDIQNVGGGPLLTLSNFNITNSNSNDVIISHPNTIGTIIGSFNIQNSIILSKDISLSILDPVNINTTLVGEVHFSKYWDNITNMTDAMLNTHLGALEGGHIIASINPLDIDIMSGIGYLQTNEYDSNYDNRSIKRIQWANSTITLPTNTLSYIYITNNNVVTSNISKPNTLANIFLGSVKTDGTTIEFIQVCHFKSLYPSNHMYDYIYDILQNQYISGSIVTVNASREIAISSGKFYATLHQFNPIGVSSPANFNQYYHILGEWTYDLDETIVNNTHYDNGSDLVVLTAEFYAKHTIYIVGDGLNEKYLLVISQTQYATLPEAELGPLSAAPSSFLNCVVRIASVIVQEGVSTIIKVLDERPFLISRSSATTIVSNHGDLIGLTNDEHTQYLLANGTRAMNGSLNMGSQNITNVGTVDSVTVSSHASRHLPTGLDPLTTAAPLSNISVSSTNTVGTANSLARSDHTHALTLSINDISPLTTKGDLIVRDSAISTRLPIGTNNQLLTVDSTQAFGLKWANPAIATSLAYLYNSATDTTSSSITVSYAIIDSMSQLTPPAGTYIVTFSTSMQISTINMVSQFAIFVAEAIYQPSHRNFISRNIAVIMPVQTQAIILVNGSQSVDVRWIVDTGTITCYERSMIMLRVL